MAEMIFSALRSAIKPPLSKLRRGSHAHTHHACNSKPPFYVELRFWEMETIGTVRCGSLYVRITVTASCSAVRNWVNYIRYRYRYHRLRGRLVVGLGVQWVPGSSVAATLQLCVGHNCLIIQLFHSDHFPNVLRRFLLDPDVILVGLWNHSDEAMLMRSRHHVEVERLVDVRNVASDLRGCSRRSSMGTLAAEILGMHGLEKDDSVGRSNWDAFRLSPEQVIYACHDAFLAFLMAKELRVWDWVDDDDDYDGVD